MGKPLTAFTLDHDALRMSLVDLAELHVFDFVVTLGTLDYLHREEKPPPFPKGRHHDYKGFSDRQTK